MAKKKRTSKKCAPKKRTVKRSTKQPAKINALKKKAHALTMAANKLQKKFEVEQKIKALKASLKK